MYLFPGVFVWYYKVAETGLIFSNVFWIYSKESDLFSEKSFL